MLNYNFRNIELDEYPEAAVEMAKGMVRDLAAFVPNQDPWLLVTPEMLVLLILRISKSSVDAANKNK